MRSLPGRRRTQVHREMIVPVRVRRLLLNAVLPGLAAGLLGVMMLVSPWGGTLEQHYGLAWLFALRGPIVPPEEVVLISIDKASAGQLGVAYDTRQWPRSLHSRLVEGLSAARARSITFDLHFKQPRADEDPAFISALQHAGNVALLEFLDKAQAGSVPTAGLMQPLIVQQRSPPTAAIAGAAAGTGPFTLPKVPNQVASFWTYDENAGSVPSLPLVTLALFLQQDYAVWRAGTSAYPGSLVDLLTNTSQSQAVAVLQGLRSFTRETGVANEYHATALSRLLSALQPPSSRYLNFYGPAQTIQTVFYADALQMLNAPDAVEYFADKAVFVGVSSPVQWQLRDAFNTVYSDPQSGLDLSGSEILATAFANLLHDSSLRQPGFAVAVSILLIVGLVLGLAAGLLRPLWALIVLGGAALVYLLWAQHLFSTRQLWLPLVVPLTLMTPLTMFSMLLWQHRRAQVDLTRIQRAFGHYLPQSTVRRLAAEGYRSLDDRQTVFGVCLITDAQGYTRVAERMSSDCLVDLVNDYLAVIIEQVRENGGEVSDIKGDSVMAFWAGRNKESDLRAAACRAVLAIDHAMAEWNRSNPYGVELPTRIGVHCGAMTLARVGAADHYEHRAVGDIVNTASRLEQLNKRFGSRLLVSQELIGDLDDAVTRCLGAVSLSGRSGTVMVNELLGWGVADSAAQAAALSKFEAARGAFDSGEYAQARTGFRELSEKWPDDPVISWYLRQLEQRS